MGAESVQYFRRRRGRTPRPHRRVGGHGMRGACRQIALLWCVASLTTTRAALDPAPDDILPGDEGEGLSLIHI